MKLFYDKIKFDFNLMTYAKFLRVIIYLLDNCMLIYLLFCDRIVYF